MKSEQIKDFNEDAIVFDELDAAYIGVARMAPSQAYAAYDYDLVYEYIKYNKGLIEFAADEYFDEHYNKDDAGPVFIKLTSIIDDLTAINSEALLPSDCFTAFIGIGYKRGWNTLAVIDLQKCVDIIVGEHTAETEEDGYDRYDQALEYLEYNSTCAYMGPDTPYYFEKYIEYVD